MQVMIVENNADMRAMLRQLIRGLCDDIIECQSGEEGLISYDHSRPDIILTEIMLPGMDGIEFLSTIRKRDPSAHVVFVTEIDEPSCHVDAMAAGAGNYFLKEDTIELQEYIMRQPALR